MANVVTVEMNFEPPLPSGVLVLIQTSHVAPHPEFLQRFRETHLGSGEDVTSTKRLIEFWLARSAAQALLQEFGIDGGFKIACGSEGQPIFPPGVAGGLSHTGREGSQFGAAIVSHQKAFAHVAVDVECLDRPLRGELRSLVEKIAHPGEIDWIFQESDRDETLRRFYTLFSAKESAFKALYATYRAPLRFQDVRIAFRKEGAVLTFLVPVAGRFRVGDSLPIYVGGSKTERLTSTVLLVPAV